MSVNRVILVGHVGKDPEVKHLDGGVTVAKFSLATNESYTDKNGQKVNQTEWHNVVVWRGLAETVEKYVKSGKLLYIEGKLKTESYEKDGVKRYTTNVVCENFRFLGSNTSKDGGEAASNAPGEAQNQETNFTPEPGLDLPF